MRTYIIREIPEESRVSFEFSVDALPVQPIADYSDAESAMRAHHELPWHEVTDAEREADEISGDVLYTAEIQG